MTLDVSNSRVVPEPLSPFSATAFAAFLVALAAGALPLAVTHDVEPAAQYARGGLFPAVLALAAALSDREANVREAAAGALWKSGKASEPTRAKLVAVLDDPDPNVVAQAAGALQSIGMKADELVEPRRRVFASPEASLTSRFLVSRNLYGKEPAAKLVEPMVAFLERSSLAKGNFTRHDIELAEEALKRIAKTQDRTLIPPLMEGARNVKAGQPILLQVQASQATTGAGRVGFSVPPSAIHVFDADTGTRLN